MPIMHPSAIQNVIKNLSDLYNKIPYSVRSNLDDMSMAIPELKTLGMAATLPFGLMKNKRYLELLDQYKAPETLVENPRLAEVIRKGGSKILEHVSPSTWWHGNSKVVDDLIPYGIAERNYTDVNNGLGIHLGGGYDVSRIFARKPNPTIYLTDVKGTNPAYFNNESALNYAINKYAGPAYDESIQNAMPPERQNIVLNLLEDILNKGHDTIMYGNSKEGYTGNPSLIVPFPTKQLRIKGRYPVNDYNIPVGAVWMHDYADLPRVRVDEISRRAGQLGGLPPDLIETIKKLWK